MQNGMGLAQELLTCPVWPAGHGHFRHGYDSVFALVLGRFSFIHSFLGKSAPLAGLSGSRGGPNGLCILPGQP